MEGGFISSVLDTAYQTRPLLDLGHKAESVNRACPRRQSTVASAAASAAAITCAPSRPRPREASGHVLGSRVCSQLQFSIGTSATPSFTRGFAAALSGGRVCGAQRLGGQLRSSILEPSDCRQHRVGSGLEAVAAGCG